MIWHGGLGCWIWAIRLYRVVVDSAVTILSRVVQESIHAVDGHVYLAFTAVFDHAPCHHHGSLVGSPACSPLFNQAQEPVGNVLAGCQGAGGVGVAGTLLRSAATRPRPCRGMPVASIV